MSEYNGWPNYATWRVSLEIVDGLDPRELGLTKLDAYDAGQWLKDYVFDYIEETSQVGIARDYALAFLDDVNWREIAKHMLDAYADEADEAADEPAEEPAEEAADEPAEEPAPLGHQYRLDV